MNIVKMAFWNFRTNLRNYSPLFLSLGFSVLVLFNFLTILFTDAFSAVGEPDTGRINYVIEAGVFILGCFMIFYIGYSAAVFLAKHKKESGVYVVMGLSNERVGRLYMAEIFMTGLAVLVSGIFFGMLTTPLFQMILGAVSDIEVELTFQFAAEPFFITTGIFLLLYSVFAVRGYRNIVRSSVFDMIPAAMTRDRIMVRPKGLVYRTVSGIGILSAGYYLSVKRGGAEAAGTFCMSAILMLWGIYLVFGGLIPLLFSSLADNKLFLYRKERTLWINNVAWRMKKNYRTYATACMLMLYEEDFMEGRQNDKRDMEEGKRIYRTFARKHANPGKYYVSAFLENSMETCMYQAKMEELFSEFGVEMGAIAGMYMEKWEAEMICAIFEEKDWEKYKHLLLIATLCKYIQQLETLYESDIPEEIQYRQACEENAVKTLEYEIKRLEQRIGGLEQQRKDKECELAEAELKIERLRREQAKKEAKYEKERAELLELRQLLSCTKQEKQEEDKKTDIGRLGRSVVIGGHRNWQKKMSKCLPNSQFLASDYMNFDPAMLHNKEYIIVNTDILKHGIYYKIMNERRKGQKVLYVHGNNVERTLREISSQLQC